MAAVTALGAARVRATGQLKRLRARLTAWVKPAKPVLANAASIPLTVAGIAVLDADVVSWNPHVGLLIVAASLFWLEHLIADEK